MHVYLSNPPKKNHKKENQTKTPAALSPYWMVSYEKTKKKTTKTKKPTHPQCAQILQLKLAEDQTDSKLFFHFPNNSFDLQVSTIQLTEINI